MTKPAETSIGDKPAKAGRPVVLQVLPSLVSGGAERGAVDIAGALVAAGGTGLVASEGGPMEHELGRVGGRHIKLPLASKNPLVMYRNIGRLVEVIRAHGVEIVHARSRAPAWSAAAAAKRTGAHFVTTFHGAYSFSNGIKRRYNAIMTAGERVIANSHFIERHIRENYSINPSRVRVIHRGIDLDRFDPERVSAERVIQLATRWRLRDGIPIIMLPGRLTRLKGHVDLIEALRRIADLDFLCVLVGSDQGRAAYKAELERLVARYDLDSRVFIPGRCDDMPAAYMLADVVVCPSTDPEAFGRVVSEAQAMGCPVIASDHGGVPEQVLDGRTAFLFPPGDREALAQALRKALGLSAPEREILSLAARTHARAHFAKEKMCQETLEVYREVLQPQTLEIPVPKAREATVP